MAALRPRTVTFAICGCLVGAAAVSMLIPPPGLIALAVGVLLLWPWGPRVETRLLAMGLDRRARLATGVLILAGAAGANLGLARQLDGRFIYRGDFQTYYVGAQVGLRHGWAHIFDQALQRPLWTAAFDGRAPFIPYLNTPPQAWLVASLALMPYQVAYAAWFAVMAGISVLVAWLLAPPSWEGRLVLALVMLGLWVLSYSLGGGQNAMFGPLAIALCWRLDRSGRQGWAGVALALVLVRPNATFLVPAALLLAGRRRAFVAWLGTSAFAGAAVLVSLGPSGVRQFLALGAEIRRTHPGAVTLTVAHVLGGGAPGLLVGVALAGLALYVAWRAGPAQPGTAIAAGVLASLFVTPYIHLQDVLTLLGAAAIVARTSTRSSFGLVLVALLLAAPPGSMFGDAWPPVLLAVVATWLVWMVVDVVGRPASTRRPSVPAGAPGSTPPAGRGRAA